MLPIDDTIAAISTPLFSSGIGVIRISGRNAISIADKCFSGGTPLTKCPAYKAQYGQFSDPGPDPISKNSNKINVLSIDGDSNTIDNSLEALDNVICLVMRSPKTFTGEDIVEFSMHGSVILLKKALNILIACGARLAEPGEFSFRAYINGKMSLTQSEAVHSLISAKSESGMRNAFLQLQGTLQDKLSVLRADVLEILANFEAEIDHPEEGLNFLTSDDATKELSKVSNSIRELGDSYELGKKIDKGISVVICGPPNSGKSTLLNALLNEDKAIVHETPGTTRDFIEGNLEISGAVINLIDTAGIRDASGEIEEEGIRRTIKKANEADIAIWVRPNNKNNNDSSNIDDEAIFKNINNREKLIIVSSKGDLLGEDARTNNNGESSLLLSAKEGWGLDKLRKLISNELATLNIENHDGAIITNLRQNRLLIKTSDLLNNALNGIKTGLGYEYIAVDINESLNTLDELIGLEPEGDMYDVVFKNFCIGK